jgi:1,4-dihydroxy-2-naphthoyl-CoA synthase
VQRVAGRLGPVRAVRRDHQRGPGLALKQAVGAVMYGTDDAREGIAAFAAKRKPRFGGH